MFNRIENDGPEDQRNRLLPCPRALDGGFIAASLLVLLTLTSTLVAGIGIVSRAAYLEQLSQLVADSAALGASETSRGLVAGFSCENAEQIAKRFDFELDTCRIVSFGASVELSKTELGLNFSATSTAGTP
ncbi:MAG: hypothetical protein RL418_155 [Actinomycetota bacterium]